MPPPDRVVLFSFEPNSAVCVQKLLYVRSMASDAQTMNLDEVFAEIGEQVSDRTRIPEPNWYTPNDFACNEARSFRDPSNGGAGADDVDEAVVRRMLRLRYDRTPEEARLRNYAPYRNWFEASRRLVRSPDHTCPRMLEAGGLIAETIRRGEKIAVYCDYDVDGTAGGAAFHYGLMPYAPDLHFGFADAQQGFGLTDTFVAEAHEVGATLLITLDCGTSQGRQVAHAQRLGMRVIVVDHHDVADNPAEFHLNPKLHDPVTSQNTGAQLAFKLAAAVQVAFDGRTRSDLWEAPMKLAGIGALADMGSVLLHENRAFFWAPAEFPPLGYAALAEAMGEDPTWPGQNVLTQAVMNLPKRTVHVAAGDIFSLLTATDHDQALRLVDRLLDAYEQAKPFREAMQEQALAQTGVIEIDEHGDRVRPRPDELVAVAVVDGFGEYAGYTGVVAGRLADRVGKPAFVIATKDEHDSHGRQIAKFSGRPAFGCPTLQELADDPEILELCTIEKVDEAGDLVQKSTFGGHARDGVFAGSVYVNRIPQLKAAIQRVAGDVQARQGGLFFPPPYDGPDAALSERKVPAARLAACERDAKRLGPYSNNRQLVLEPADGHQERYEKHAPVKISVCGRLRDLSPDPDTDGRWLAGTLELDGGIVREIRFPADVEAPEGRLCEWVLRLGGPAPYWLRVFHELEPLTSAD
jgi:single-stranded DNA-specific DHH superfamily exonuclease